jgi:hypothetical protein
MPTMKSVRMNREPRKTMSTAASRRMSITGAERGLEEIRMSGGHAVSPQRVQKRRELARLVGTMAARSAQGAPPIRYLTPGRRRG